MKIKQTWILVADGSRARIFKRSGKNGALEPAFNHDFAQPSMPNREIISDKPGRGQGGRGLSGSHGMTPRVDAHEQEKHSFAKEVARFVNREAERHAFDELVVVAPPKTLGDLRADFSEQSRALIRAELAKDLTHLSIHDLPGHLSMHL